MTLTGVMFVTIAEVVSVCVAVVLSVGVAVVLSWMCLCLCLGYDRFSAWLNLGIKPASWRRGTAWLACQALSARVTSRGAYNSGLTVGSNPGSVNRNYGSDAGRTKRTGGEGRRRARRE